MGPIIYINTFEYFLLPVYIILIFWLTSRIVKKYYQKNVRAVYLYAAVGFKLMGSIIFALMSQFFFKEGDTFMYFSAGLDIQKAVFHNLPSGINILFLDPPEFGRFYEETFSNSNNYGYIGAGANLFTAKFSCFVSLVSFNGYLLTSVLFGLLALSGMWRLFILFTSLFPTLSREWSICFLFLPSIVYWGGGVMKDTICLGALGWFFSSFYYYFKTEKKKWIHILIMLSTIYLLYNVKVYIAGTILLVTAIWFTKIKIASINNLNLQRLITASLSILLITLVTAYFDIINDYVSDQLLSMFADYVKDAKKNYELTSSESALMTNVTEINTSLTSVIMNVPSAISNALFRPFLWEASSVNILMAGLENFIILAFTIFVLIRRGPGIIYTIFTNHMAGVCFSFSLLFAIFIGLTCFNFGTMVRYKLPCIPFYCATLFLLYNYTVKAQKI